METKCAAHTPVPVTMPAQSSQTRRARRSWLTRARSTMVSGDEGKQTDTQSGRHQPQIMLLVKATENDGH
jgi:hypothetical protein